MWTMLFAPRRIVQSNSCFSAVMYNPLEEKFTPGTLLSRPSSDFSTLLLAPVAIKRNHACEEPLQRVWQACQRETNVEFNVSLACTGFILDALAYISKEEYSELQQSTDPWFYIKCTHDMLPFHDISSSDSLVPHAITDASAIIGNNLNLYFSIPPHHCHL